MSYFNKPIYLYRKSKKVVKTTGKQVNLRDF